MLLLKLKSELRDSSFSGTLSVAEPSNSVALSPRRRPRTSREHDHRLHRGCGHERPNAPKLSPLCALSGSRTRGEARHFTATGRPTLRHQNIAGEILAKMRPDDHKLFLPMSRKCEALGRLIICTRFENDCATCRSDGIKASKRWSSITNTLKSSRS